MKKGIKSFCKRYWILCWCVISVVSFGGILALAEYEIAYSTMKRVVVSTSDQGKMFSSNILVESGNTTYIAKYYPQHEENPETHVTDPYDVDVYLWNYSLNNLSKWYSTDIDYKITFKLTDSNGTPLTAESIGSKSVQLIKVIKESILDIDPETGEQTVTESERSQYVSTLDNTNLDFTTTIYTLVHDVAKSAEDRYILRFSGNWNLDSDSEICVQTIATPYKGEDTTKYRDISALAAIIGLRKNKGEEATGWQAYLAEESDELDVEDCAGYNLVVTGSGQKKITIKWDPTKISCNRNFYNNTIYSFGEDEIEYTNGTAQIIINADSGSQANGLRNRYDIQFYKKEGTDPSDWSFFKNDGSDLGENVWLSVKIE